MSRLLHVGSSAGERQGFLALMQDADCELVSLDSHERNRLDAELAAADIIVIDGRIGWQEAEAVLARLRHPGAPPALMLLGRGGEQEAIRALHAGASELLPPGFSRQELALRLERLGRVAAQQRVLAEQGRALGEMTAEVGRLRDLAYRDHLTGLPNRLSLFEWGERAAQWVREAAGFALHVLDLDGFKIVNDTHGHPAGDVLLREVCERLGRIPRKIDRVARLGGDEIAVVQIGATTAADAQSFAERLLRTLDEPFTLNGSTIAIQACIGSALAPMHGDDLDVLLRKADHALYQAKAAGSGSFRFFQDSEAPIPELDGLDPDLAPAHADAQPVREGTARFALIIDLARGQLAGADHVALPDGADPFAALEASFRQARIWEVDGQPIRFSVTLPPAAAADPSLAAALDAMLARTRAAPACCEIALAEADADARPTVLSALRARGIGVAVRVGATDGRMPPLMPLGRLPITRLILDEACTAALAAGPGDRLSRPTGIRLTASGVAEQQQLQALKALGIDEITGPFIGPPLPETHFPRLLADLRRSAPRRDPAA